jgi:hypothetical protein
MTTLIITDLPHVEDLSDVSMSRVSGGIYMGVNPIVLPIATSERFSCATGKHIPVATIVC